MQISGEKIYLFFIHSHAIYNRFDGLTSSLSSNASWPSMSSASIASSSLSSSAAAASWTAASRIITFCFIFQNVLDEILSLFFIFFFLIRHSLIYRNVLHWSEKYELVGPSSEEYGGWSRTDQPSSNFFSCVILVAYQLALFWRRMFSYDEGAFHPNHYEKN